MSTYWTKERIDDVGALTDAGTLVWAPGAPVDVFRLILVTTTAYTVANDTVTVSVRNVDDSSSVTKGTFVIPFTGSALNKVMHVVVDKSDAAGVVSAIDGSLVFTAGEGVIEVNPGQELVIVDGGQQTAGASRLYVEYVQQGFSGSRVQAAQELAFVSA